MGDTSNSIVTKKGKWRVIFLVTAALIVKCALATLSAWGPDFLYGVKAAVIGHPPSLSNAYWVYINHLIYQFWLYLPVDHVDLEPWIIKPEVLTPEPSLYLLIFMLKLPIIVLDLGCGYLIYRLALARWGRTAASRSFYLWIWNPYVTLTAEMMGTNDILPATLILITLLFFIGKRRVSSGISIFTAIAAKLSSILILPVLIIRSYSNKGMIILLAASISGILAYFYWMKSVFDKGWALTLMEHSPLTYSFSEILISPRSDLNIGLATVSAIIFTYAIYRFWDGDKLSTIDAVFSFLLAYFAFSNWWPQYLLLLMPFMTLKAAYSRRWLLHISVITLIAFLLGLISFNFSGKFHLFFISNYFEWMNSGSAAISYISREVVITLVLQPILRSIFACLSIYYAVKLLVQNSHALKRFLSWRR